MKSLERGVQKESLDALVLSAAHAYGFTTTPVTLTRSDIVDMPDDTDSNVAYSAALANKIGVVEETTQTWGTAKKDGGTAIVFAAASPKLSTAQAFVVKAALVTCESAGFSDPVVLISSIGDNESRRRYVRELGNFFKKNAKELSEDLIHLSAKYPDEAAQSLINDNHELANSLPRTIDYLSESSRKIMLETISLFETLGIVYELEPRLTYTPDVQQELVFAIDAKDKKGNVVRVASGGRFEKGEKKKNRTDIIGMSVSLPERIDTRGAAQLPTPACFVVHVGEAAKLKAFTLLESLWRAQIDIGQALLAETIQEQMERAKSSDTKYVAIIGQREALDDTVIIKNTGTQIQETIPLAKLIGRMSRVRT